MKEMKLPDQFESFGDARKEGFLAVKALKEQDKRVVGVFCTYSPLEIIMAAGAVGVSLCSFSDETIGEAEKVLPRNLCPLIKSSYGFAVSDKCPYMYFADLLVGETTCDGKKKMYELLGDIKNMHVLQLPQRQDDEPSRQLWLEEVLKLKDRIENDFGVTITEEDVRNAIALKNRERDVLTEFYQLSMAVPPPMTGMAQQKVLYGSQFKFDIEEKIKDIRAVVDKAKADYDMGIRPVPESAKRILITGCPLAGATEKVITAIEENGGVVVAYENCTGIKNIINKVSEEGDPYQAIADRYLKIGCSVMTPDDNRKALLEQLIQEFKVDGVVEMTLQACHTYAIETTTIRDFVQGKGVPFLTVETDYSASDAGQLKTRIAAFIEMLD